MFQYSQFVYYWHAILLLFSKHLIYFFFFSSSDMHQSHYLSGFHAFGINSSLNSFLSFINLVSLRKKLFRLEKKLKQFPRQKSFLLIVIKITGFLRWLIFIVNSNNQGLIHHNNCFECTFYHQSKTRKSCLFHRFLFYDLYLKLNVSKKFYWTKHFYSCYDYCRNNISIYTFFFFMLTIIINQISIHLWL